MEARERGEKTELLPEEIQKYIKKERKAKREALESSHLEFEEKFRSLDDSDEAVSAPLLDESDVNFVAQNQVRLTQKEILKLHVKNWADLSLKNRRKVLGHIQAQRSQHAKEVFLKELSAIGAQN